MHPDRRASDPDAPVQTAIRALKREVKDLIVITDVCLCEYTSHGHCGIVEGDDIVNDVTVMHLAQAALSHAVAGADVVAPSDMMDGRVAAIRRTLDERGLRADGASCRTRRSTAPASTAHSARPRIQRRSSAIVAAINSILPTSKKPCAKWKSTSPRGPTSCWSSRRSPTSMCSRK